MVNNASHGSGLPPLSPSSAYSSATQAAGARAGYLETLAALRQNQALARGTLRTNISDARLQKIADVQGAANNALDRGIGNSSIDLGGRAQAWVQFARNRAAAQQQYAQSGIQDRLTAIGARGQMNATLAGISAQDSIERQSAALSELASQPNGPDWNAVMAYIRAMKQGNVPVTRTGVQQFIHPQSYYLPGQQHGV